MSPDLAGAVVEASEAATGTACCPLRGPAATSTAARERQTRRRAVRNSPARSSLRKESISFPRTGDFNQKANI